MNSNQTAAAKAAATREYLRACTAWNTALTSGAGARVVSATGRAMYAAETASRFATADHERAIRAEMAGASEAKIQTAARAS